MDVGPIDLEERRRRFHEAVGWPSLVRGDDAELAFHLMKERQASGPTVFSDGTYYEYVPAAGVWKQVDEAVLSRTVQRYAGAPLPLAGKTKVLKVSAGTVRGTIKLAYDRVAKPKFFDDAPAGIAFRNGFVRVQRGAVRVDPHAPENLARERVELEYDPAAPHPELDRFFDAVFADASEEERAARVMCLQEFTGACLVGEATRYQRCIVAVGPGGNGKSQCEEIIRSPFPVHTVCSLPPQQWGERFQISKLVGALANIVDEIPEKEIMSGEVFKSVVTGEPVHMERKHRDPFEARPRAGHLFSANTLPGTADLTHGFFRRFIVIRFDRDMEHAPESRRDAARDVIMLNLPGIAAWAIEGAARLQRQGGYTVPASSAEAISEWKRTSDNVALFIEEKTIPADKTRTITLGNGTMAAQLYRRYRQWCDDSGYHPVASKKFSARMADLKLPGIKQNSGTFYPVREAS